MKAISAILAVVFLVVFIGVIVKLILLAICAIRHSDTAKMKKSLKSWSIVLLASFVASSIIEGSQSNTDDELNEIKKTEVVEPKGKEKSAEPEKTPKPTPEPTPEPTSELSPAITKQEIIDNCASSTYKDLLRYPDKHIGDYVIVKVKIHQVLKETFGYDTFYFGYTDNDGYEFYFDDEYCIVDERVDDDTKILDDDILVIYGEFTGLKTFKRALTRTSDELPCLNALYIDIEN